MWEISWVITLESVNKISSAVLTDGTTYLVCSSNFWVCDEILWCYHPNETSSAVLFHGTNYSVCRANFWVCGWNQMKPLLQHFCLVLFISWVHKKKIGNVLWTFTFASVSNERVNIVYLRLQFFNKIVSEGILQTVSVNDNSKHLLNFILITVPKA